MWAYEMRNTGNTSINFPLLSLFSILSFFFLSFLLSLFLTPFHSFIHSFNHSLLSLIIFTLVFNDDGNYACLTFQTCRSANKIQFKSKVAYGFSQPQQANPRIIP